MDGTTSQLDSIVVQGRGSALRRPRARVLINGEELPGLKAANVRKNNYFHADTFDMTFALWFVGAKGPSWWLAQDKVDVEVQMGREPEEGEIAWRTVLKGKVDDIDMTWGGGMMSLKGRDKTALMIDAKTREAFHNKTASEIVTTLAARHGLTADVTATTTRAGTYYERDHVSVNNGEFSRAQTEWDTITYLARQEGFDAWVSGDTLYFKPLSEDRSEAFVITLAEPERSGQMTVSAQSNVKNFSLTRNLALAKDIKVIVRSWNSGHGKRYEAKTESKKPARGRNATSGGGSGDEVTEYHYTFPNLTQAEAQVRANKLHEQISRQQWTIEFELPGTLGLDPRQKVTIQGVERAQDELYYVDSVDLGMDATGGWTMQVRAKNTPEPNGEASPQ